MIYRTGISLAGMIAAATLPLKAAVPVFPNAPGGNDFPTTVPCGKTLVIPLVTDDPDGDAVSYTVTSSNPHVMARVRSGDFHYKVTVHSDNDGTGAALDGDMEFQMFRNVTPETASAIAGFAQSGYYDNVLFHRVIPEFVIQGGDPAGTGSGTSPYTIRHEFRPELIYTGRGQLAMANSAGGYSQTFPNNGNFRYRTGSFEATNGSQFFVTLGQPRHLDFKHTLFGQLVRGFPTLDRIEAVPTDADDEEVANPVNKPVTPVKMTTHAVTASRTDAVLLISAKSTGTANLTVTARDSSGESATKTFTINAVVDDTNDPPMLLPFEPQVAPVGGFPGISINSFDLEHDAISTRIPVQDIFNPSGIIYAGVSAANLSVIGRPDAGAWDIAFGVAQLNDPLLESDPFSASRFQTLEIGLGDKALIAKPRTLEAEAGTSTGPTVLATFRHGAASASPEDYIAVVQWGDGTSVQTSTGTNPPITIVRSATEPGAFEVRGAHTFARPGIYPVHVILDAPIGATDTARG
jgi:cyclophilin family peptidyl-prolyl cis-trans isomerase